DVQAMDRRRIRLRTIWSPPLRSDPRQPAASSRLLSTPARRFQLAGSGDGCSSNRGWLDYGDRGVHAGQFPGVRSPDDDGRGAGDEPMSLIYSTLMSVADRSEGAAMNRWSPYLLSILRIIAAFVYMVHGTQKLFGFPAPFPMPHLPPLFLAGGIIEA